MPKRNLYRSHSVLGCKEIKNNKLIIRFCVYNDVMFLWRLCVVAAFRGAVSPVAPRRWVYRQIQLPNRQLEPNLWLELYGWLIIYVSATLVFNCILSYS
jgi:hypothetical protein